MVNKFLYIRQYNGENRKDKLPAIIVGDSTTENGRDNAYRAEKGEEHDLNFDDIKDCETGEIYKWPKVAIIKLTDEFKRDYLVHNLLKERARNLVKWDGEKNEGEYRTREAFIIKKNHTVEEVIDFINKAMHGNISKVNYGLRNYQTAAAMSIIEKFDKFEDVLLQAAPRFGKSFVSLRIAKNLNKKRILILTPYPDAKLSFKDVVLTHDMMHDYQFIDLQNKKTLLNANKFVLFLSWASFAGGNNKKLLSQINPDFIIIDEMHRQSDTEKSKEILNKIIKNKKIKTLYLSATPYNDILYGDFKSRQDQIVNFDLIDMYNACQNTAQKFPILNFYFPENCDNFYEELSEKIEFDDSSKFTLDKMLADSEHPEYAKTYWEHYFISPIDITGIPTRKTIFSTLKEKPKHILIFVPDGSADINTIALNDLANNKDSVIYDYKILQASCEENETDIKKFEQDVNNFHDTYNKTIVISKGKGTTGVTLEKLDCVIIAKKMQSTELFVQVACRPITPFNNKNSVSVFCMDSEMRLTLANVANVSMHTAPTKAKKRLKRFFSVINAYYFSENNFIKEDVNSLLTFIKDFKVKSPSECYKDMQNLILPELSNDIISEVMKIKIDDFNEKWSKIIGKGGNKGGKTSIKQNTNKKAKNKIIKHETIREHIMQLFSNIDWIILMNNYNNVNELSKHIFSENKKLNKCAHLVINENDALFDNMCYKIMYTKKKDPKLLINNLSLKNKTDIENKDIIEKMIKNIDIDTCDINKTFLDPCAGRGRYLNAIYDHLMKNKNFIKKFPDENERSEYIRKNNIYGNDIDENLCYILKIQGYKNVFNYNVFSKEFDKMCKNIDYIIGNPPYGQHGLGSLDLHYEIAESMFGKYNDKMIFIMPGRVGFSTSEKFDKWKKKFSNVSSIEYVGNPFEGSANVEVDIFTFENHVVDKINVRGIEYNSLFDISPFTDYENKFMNALKNEKPNYNAYRPLGKDKKENAKKFNNNYFNRFNNNSFLTISCLANGAKNAKFFTSKDVKKIFNKKELKEYCYNNKNACKVISEFKTKKEAVNYTNALQRPLCRFSLAKLQDDQSMTERVYSYIPNIDWSDDKTKTDEGILELLGFSKKEAKEFAKYTKDYIYNFDNKIIQK